MQTRGAIVRQAPGKYEVVDLEVDDPRPGEIQVKLVATGLCHSDDHVATGDIPVGVYPFAGGHEGAGIVTQAGAEPQGDQGGRPRRLLVPALLRALPLVRLGQQNLCDLGAGLLAGSRWDDPTDFRLKLAGDGHPGRPDVRHLDVRGDHHGLGRLGGEGRRRPAAGQGLPARLQRGHRLGFRGQLRARCSPGTP